MKEGAELVRALRQLVGNEETFFMAKVTSVNKAADTCDVIDDGFEYGNVRLRSVIMNNSDGWKAYPKIGSDVLVAVIDKSGGLGVAMFGEIGEIVFKVNGVEFTVNETGFKHKKGTTSLADIVDDLFGQVKAISAELQKVVVAIGVTPNVPALQGIDAQIDINRNKAKDLLK